jgi:hypothetical protein
MAESDSIAKLLMNYKAGDPAAMPDDIPYDLKYAPLIQCLAGRKQTAWLNEYPSRIVKHFENIDDNILKMYMTELERDFNGLYALAVPIALNDVELAKRLVKIKDALVRLKRLLRGQHISVFADAQLNLRALLRTMQDLQLVLRPIV